MPTLAEVLDGLTQAIAADESTDVVTGDHKFKVDEPDVLGGTNLAAGTARCSTSWPTPVPIEPTVSFA